MTFQKLGEAFEKIFKLDNFHIPEQTQVTKH